MGAHYLKALWFLMDFLTTFILLLSRCLVSIVAKKTTTWTWNLSQFCNHSHTCSHTCCLSLNGLATDNSLAKFVRKSKRCIVFTLFITSVFWWAGVFSVVLWRQNSSMASEKSHVWNLNGIKLPRSKSPHVARAPVVKVHLGLTHPCFSF